MVKTLLPLYEQNKPSSELDLKKYSIKFLYSNNNYNKMVKAEQILEKSGIKYITHNSWNNNGQYNPNKDPYPIYFKDPKNSLVANEIVSILDSIDKCGDPCFIADQNPRPQDKNPQHRVDYSGAPDGDFDFIVYYIYKPQ
jgi:hypothetical protein